VAEFSNTALFRLCVSIVPSFLILLGSGNEGFWVARILVVVGFPFFLLFIVAAVKFSESMNRYPARWAGGGVGLVASAGYFTAGKAGLILPLIVSVPSAIIFVLWNIWLPIKAEAD
jgi:hypothetical protein